MDLYQATLEMAKLLLLRRGILRPTVLMEYKGKLMTRQIRYSNDEEKQVAVKLAKEELQAKGITEYVFIAESWYAMTNDSVYCGFIPPSQSPNRQECLIIGYSSKKEKKATMIPFKRTESNKIVLCEPISNDNRVGGIFAELLEDD